MLQNAQAGTHAIREAQAQAQAYSIMIAPSVRAVHHDILLFACSELAVSVEHLFEVFLRFLRGGGGGRAAASGWPSAGCTSCGRSMIPAGCRSDRSRSLSTRSKCYILHCKATSFALS